MSGPPVDPALKAAVWAAFGPWCWICGQAIVEPDWDPDHVNPRSQGGATTLNNLRPAHPGCNRSRQDGPPQSPGQVWQL